MKRTDTLKADPEKTRAWKERTAARLPRVSPRRRRDEKVRKTFREFVLKHRPTCEAHLFCCSGRATEVNELQRGPAREDCWLDWDKVTALCNSCHAWLTAHPEWALHHGHQLQHEGIVTMDDWAGAGLLRMFFRTHLCHPRCTVDHRAEPWPPTVTVLP